MAYSLHTVIAFIRLIWSHNRTIQKQLIVSTGLTLLLSITTLGLPLIFSTIVQQFTDTTCSTVSLIPLLLAGYGIVWTLQQIIDEIRSNIANKLLEESVNKISMILFDHLHTLSLGFHRDRKMALIMNALDRVQSGIESIFWGMLLYLLPLFLQLLLILIPIAYFYGIHYVACTLIIIAVFVYWDMYMLQTSVPLQQQYRAALNTSHTKFFESITNIETVRYFNNEQFERTQCKTLFTAQEKAGIARYAAEVKLTISQLLCIGTAITLVTFSSGQAVAANTMTLSTFILINGYLLQFIIPIRTIGYIVKKVKKGMEDIATLTEILNTKPEVIDRPHATPLVITQSNITFENVSFGYDDKRLILNNVSFTVPTGKTVALVGPSGSGKSTIARLIFRFYDTTNGTIYINNQSITHATQESLHQALGIVPQDIVLFNDTLYYNIAYGNPRATREEVEFAAQAAQLDHFIALLPDRYQTMVGERGLKLSGGERQRIAIARVLLKNPAIYIFDEATSALDTRTEQAILKTMRTISYGATTLIIAHRLSTIMHADTIIVLNQGTIVEQGTHDQLLAQPTLYSQLWNQQLKKNLQF